MIRLLTRAVTSLSDSSCAVFSASASRRRQDVSHHEQGWRGDCVHFDLWPPKSLSSFVPDHQIPLLQPRVLLGVSAAEEGPENVSDGPRGEQQSSLFPKCCDFLLRTFSFILTWFSLGINRLFVETETTILQPHMNVLRCFFAIFFIDVYKTESMSLYSPQMLIVHSSLSLSQVIQIIVGLLNIGLGCIFLFTSRFSWWLLDITDHPFWLGILVSKLILNRWQSVGKTSAPCNPEQFKTGIEKGSQSKNMQVGVSKLSQRVSCLSLSGPVMDHNSWDRFQPPRNPKLD